jgi:hypothetical protein
MACVAAYITFLYEADRAFDFFNDSGFDVGYDKTPDDFYWDMITRILACALQIGTGYLYGRLGWTDVRLDDRGKAGMGVGRICLSM